MKPLDPTAVSRAVARDWDRFRTLATGAAARPEGWAAATRCSGWTVADLAAHAVWGASMEADALRRCRLGITGPAEGENLTGATPAGGDQILARLDAAVGALRAELDQVADADGERLVPLPYGDIPLGLFLQILTMEAAVHTDDLAAALTPGVRRLDPGNAATPAGVLPANRAADPAGGLNPDSAAATAVVLAAFLPVFGAASSAPPAAGTIVALAGPSVDLRLHHVGDGRWEVGEYAGAHATVAGDDSTVLLYALGRVAADDPRLSLSGFPGLATRFKRWFPGP